MEINTPCIEYLGIGMISRYTTWYPTLFWLPTKTGATLFSMFGKIHKRPMTCVCLRVGVKKLDVFYVYTYICICDLLFCICVLCKHTHIFIIYIYTYMCVSLSLHIYIYIYMIMPCLSTPYYYFLFFVLSPVALPFKSPPKKPTSSAVWPLILWKPTFRRREKTELIFFCGGWIRFKSQSCFFPTDTSPKFNIATEKWCLKDYSPIGKITFQGLC